MINNILNEYFEIFIFIYVTSTTLQKSFTLNNLASEPNNTIGLESSGAN